MVRSDRSSEVLHIAAAQMYALKLMLSGVITDHKEIFASVGQSASRAMRGRWGNSWEGSRWNWAAAAECARSGSG